MTLDKAFYRACALGSAIGTLIACLVHPHWWWLGLVAGFCAGYILQDAAAFARAIPRAWDAAIRSMQGEARATHFENGQEKAGLLAGIVTVPACSAVLTWVLDRRLVWGEVLFCLMLAVVVAFGLTWCFLMLCCVLGVAASGEWKAYCMSFATNDYLIQCRRISWKQWVRFFFFGLFFGLFWLVGIVIYWVAFAVFAFAFYYFWIGAYLFLKHLILFTITHERVLAGFCSAFGAATAYLYFGRPHNPTPGQILFLVVCGGFLGWVAGRVASHLLGLRSPSAKAA
jgi:hypothetical protein